jgi:hypothetical protein
MWLWMKGKLRIKNSKLKVMKKTLFILLVLSWAFFLFFFEKQGSAPTHPIEKTSTGMISTGSPLK